jgi:hypothetical protein
VKQKNNSSNRVWACKVRQAVIGTLFAFKKQHLSEKQTHLVEESLITRHLTTCAYLKTIDLAPSTVTRLFSSVINESAMRSGYLCGIIKNHTLNAQTNSHSSDVGFG